jgi:polyhydroxybutyrate depolymerase
MGAEKIVRNCPKCGSILDEDGNCPRCGKMTKEKKVKLSKRMKILMPIIIVVAVLATAFGYYYIIYLHSTRGFTLNFAGVDRNYWLYIPSSYDGKTPVPLVIVLHGLGESPSSVEGESGMSKKADAEGFIVVYPEGIGSSWNAGFGMGTAYASNVDDVGFIRELISSLQQSYKIDGNRIYVAGFSNGACMAYRLAAELSDRIAAAAILSGAAGGRYNSTSPRVINVGSNSAQPVSIIVFHGTADSSVPYDGGSIPFTPPSPVISVNESVSLWVRHDGCSELPQIEEMSGTSTSHNMTVYIFSRGEKGTEVVLFKVIGGQHEWPATATDYIWAFFKSHPKTG